MSHFEKRVYCSRKCQVDALREKMSDKRKHVNDLRNQNRPTVEEPHDYRTSPEAQQLLTKIETVVKKKKKGVTTRFINERFAIPRRWNLWDIIAVSKEIEIDVDSPRLRVVARPAVVGIPEADEFQVTASKEKVDLGLV